MSHDLAMLTSVLIGRSESCDLARDSGGLLAASSLI